MKMDVVLDQSARYYTSTKPMPKKTPLQMELGNTLSSLMDIERRAVEDLNPGISLDYHLIVSMSLGIESKSGWCFIFYFLEY